MTKMIELTPPGVMLKEDFLGELGISQAQLAEAIGVDRAAISKILSGQREITADMSIKLGLFFGQSESFWFNLQRDYDMRKQMAEKMPLYKKTIRPFTAVQPVV